ncbi:MAG: UbiX family flavin prenyltransferase [Planctomycetes bacterium]|jgi:4-hydroxy-3-polyprenylbenzoate decarboxylase|nr:UbiX family flavin prenyltransferase [Planctomycetota bacterium]
MAARKARQVAVCVTGASGAVYAREVLEACVSAGFGVHWAVTRRGAEILETEAGVRVDADRPDAGPWLSRPAARRIVGWGIQDFRSPMASGSGGIEAVCVVPCSMGAAGRIACGASTDLVERAADVALKERRTLVLVPRETPLSAVHLGNLLALSRAGAVILPAAPAFYFGPATIGDLAGFLAAKVLQQLGVPVPARYAWGGAEIS